LWCHAASLGSAQPGRHGLCKFFCLAMVKESKLRRVDLVGGKNKQVPHVCKLLEFTEQAYFARAAEISLWLPAPSPTSA
jgi:hypothetical protein